MDQYQAIIIAIIMAIPPLVAQVIAAIKNARDASSDRRKETTAQRRDNMDALRMAAEQWERLYNESQEEVAGLENANKTMLAALRERDEQIEKLQEQIRELTTAKPRRTRRKTAQDTK